MVCEYEFDEETKTIKVNCLGCMYGSSIEDHEMCMSTTLDKILENKNVTSVVLLKNRAFEYPYEQVRLLVEIIDAFQKIIQDKYVSKGRVEKKCEKIVGDRISYLQWLIIEKFRKDPIGAYVDLKRKVRQIKILSNEMDEKGECNKILLKNVVLPILSILENTKLIKMTKPLLSGYHVGNRDIYREIFHPTIRPNFMRTKYVAQPPKDGELIDKYTLKGEVEVEVYKIPGSIRYVYHAFPPEFQLSEDVYTILDAARRYMEKHKPRAAEFANPERMREIFFNIGRDMISDIARGMNVSLTGEELNVLADLLTRHTAGLGVLEILLADEKIQDVYINSPIGNTPIYIYHSDMEECETNLIPTQDDAESWATRFRMMSGRPLDEANPVLDTQVTTTSGTARIAVITRTLSPHGLGFALRRHRDDPWTFPLFLQPEINYFNPLFAGLMSFIVDGNRTFLVAGTRSSGKTSLLSAIMLEIMSKFRIITVEDTLELPVRKIRNLGFNVESLKSRSVITRVETELPAEEAIRTALRLGDSCLIIGEVRSLEAKALYEAMRVGALANTVAGTIHGESAYGVFDRVVNDLEVPATSFKATDIIVICNMLKSADGLHRYRRVTGITEVRKHWQEDPMEEGGFVNLMEYSSKEGQLKPTDTFLNGESMVLNEIASKVKEWSGNWAAVWDNINLRGNMKKTITDYALRTGKKWMMEAPFVVKSNNMFHLICERLRDEVGSIPSDRAFEEWEFWLKGEIKEKIKM